MSVNNAFVLVMDPVILMDVSSNSCLRNTQKLLLNVKKYR